MSDSHIEFTSQSWSSRIGQSLKGILFGLILIPGAVALLWWNEGRAVITANSIKEGAGTVVHVDSGHVDAANDQKLVHVSGDARAENPVSDPVFATTVPALRLERQVQIYQWVENKKTETHEKAGGSKETVTTYTYEKKWSDEVIDSSRFKQAAEHKNTGSLVASNGKFNAKEVTLGAFRVPDSMVSALPGEVNYPVTETDYEKLEATLKAKAKRDAGNLYFGNDPGAPQIGDQRIGFKVVNPGAFSFIAQQTGDTFQPYQTKAGRALSYIESGTVSAETMFKNALNRNTLITWLARLGGFLLMSFGFMTIMRPLAILGSVLPFLGNLIGLGTGLISFALSATISVLVVAVAWFTVRPLLGIGLLVVAAVGFLMIRKMAAGSKGARQ